MYQLNFKCKFCQKDLPVATTHCGNEGIAVYCDCPESRKDWEQKHREDMERRKQLRRGLR